jgi:hypothetical protein
MLLVVVAGVEVFMRVLLQKKAGVRQPHVHPGCQWVQPTLNGVLALAQYLPPTRCIVMRVATLTWLWDDPPSYQQTRSINTGSDIRKLQARRR